MSEVLDTFKQRLRETRAELQGKALSRARMLKPLSEIRPGARKEGRPEPTDVHVRMLDGKPMTFHSDGSLRHFFGSKPGKAARKALKKQRVRERKQGR